MGENELSIKAREALREIGNWVMLYGKMPSVRDLMSKMGYKSPRSPMLLLEELAANGFLERKSDGTFKIINHLSHEIAARTVSIPLIGNVSCGIPMLAEENVEAMIPVSAALAKSGFRYFLLRAMGNSMNKVGIDPGDLVLVKQQPVAENGQYVVALIDDEATIKEFQHKGNVVALIPHSSDPRHKPIILESEFQIQGVVVTTIRNMTF